MNALFWFQVQWEMANMVSSGPNNWFSGMLSTFIRSAIRVDLQIRFLVAIQTQFWRRRSRYNERNQQNSFGKYSLFENHRVQKMLVRVLNCNHQKAKLHFFRNMPQNINYIEDFTTILCSEILQRHLLFSKVSRNLKSFLRNCSH